MVLKEISQALQWLADSLKWEGFVSANLLLFMVAVGQEVDVVSVAVMSLRSGVQQALRSKELSVVAIVYKDENMRVRWMRYRVTQLQFNGARPN